jgi:hypothetical protein
MLIDKLEENGERISLSGYAGELRASHGYLHIVNNGRFSFAERVALASTMNKLHRASTKIAIIETLFDGKDRESKPYIPGETLTVRKITEQAQQILDKELARSYAKQYKELATGGKKP